MKSEQMKRFWDGVQILSDPDECWHWQGSTHRPNGYGQIGINGRLFYTHRLAYQATNGEIPPGLEVLHTCDNPACCNPRHLFLGTQSENVKDMVKKGRQSGAKGERSGKAKLTWDKVHEIRRRYVPRSKQNGSAALAEEFGVDRSTIYAVVSNEKWQE